MSDTAETADGTVRLWLSGTGLACTFAAVDLIFVHGSIVGGLNLLAVSGVFYWAQYRWIWLKTRINPNLLRGINSIATNARWWFGLLGVILLTIALSPYVEQQRWPFAWLISPPTQTEIGADPPWIDVAFKEYEQARLIAPNNNPRILEYLHSIPGTESKTDKVDWASAFVEWTLNQVRIDDPKSVKASAWLRWGRQINKPQKGAIAVFNFDGTEHVGFVIAESGDDLIVLGGNQEQRVEVRRYPKANLRDYRMPILVENGNGN